MNDDPISVLHKHPKKQGFVQVENSTVRDPRLSLKATGLLIYLISLPQGSPIGSRVLARRKPDGRTASMSAFKELRDFGYVEQRSHRGKDGTFTTTTHVYEVPPGSVSQPGSGFGYPTTENRAISLSESKTNDKEDRLSFICRFCADVLVGVDAYQLHLEICDEEGFRPADQLTVIAGGAA